VINKVAFATRLTSGSFIPNGTFPKSPLRTGVDAARPCAIFKALCGGSIKFNKFEAPNQVVYPVVYFLLGKRNKAPADLLGERICS
jgi:hypothetical protein